MIKSNKQSALLISLFSLGLLSLPLLAGCQKAEEKQPAGYYEGPRDPKSGSPATGAGGKLDAK